MVAPRQKDQQHGSFVYCQGKSAAYHLEISICFPPYVILQVCSIVNMLLCGVINNHSFTFIAPSNAALKTRREIRLPLQLTNNCNILSFQKLSSGKTAYDMRTMGFCSLRCIGYVRVQLPEEKGGIYNLIQIYCFVWYCVRAGGRRG